MENRRTENRQLAETCEECKTFEREAGHMEAFTEVYKHLNTLFDEKLGNYESNSLKLKSHNHWLFALTLVHIIEIAFIGFILIFK
jgi:hypothetical protein